jgi:hypothetical protein
MHWLLEAVAFVVQDFTLAKTLKRRATKPLSLRAVVLASSVIAGLLLALTWLPA